MTPTLETVQKELDDLKKALAQGKDLKALTPVKVDMTYLCSKDPNREKIIKADGVVMPDDGPKHLGGYITDIAYTDEKKRTFVEGRQTEFVVKRKSAKWICSTCGSEKTIDPYLV